MSVRWRNYVVTFVFEDSGWDITYRREVYHRSRELAVYSASRRTDYPTMLGCPKSIQVEAS
jgi:hypothetical protein